MRKNHKDVVGAPIPYENILLTINNKSDRYSEEERFLKNIKEITKLMSENKLKFNQLPSIKLKWDQLLDPNNPRHTAWPPILMKPKAPKD